MWVILLAEDKSVVCAQKQRPPQKLFDSPKHEVFEWFGPAPPQHDPEEGVESYDPRPDGYETHRVDFDSLAERTESEIAYLEGVIPAIDTMDAAQVRDVVKRLAQENQQMLRAWRYILVRLQA